MAAVFQRIAFLVLALLANLAHADSGGVLETIKIPGLGTVRHETLFEAVGEPGETADAFITRIAPQLHAYTARTGWEACGFLATDGERFGIVVGTQRGHTLCVNFRNRLPAGFQVTRYTVHSHSTQPTYRANRTDLLLLGVSAGLGDKVRGDDPELFSEEDFAGAPGYMIGARAVWHQDGKEKVRKVADLP